MLAHRIIPVMLQRGSTLVKGKRFNSWRTVGHAEQAVAIHQARGVDELIYLDIAATPEGRGPDIEMVRRLTAGCFMPITVGGGVRTIEHVRELLNAGADKVAIRTGAIANATLVHDAASHFGCQAIVVAIDVVGGLAGHVLTLGAGPGPKRWAQDLVDVGAGEILLTSVDREGTLEGYDLELISAVSSSVDVPVIAHGGCGTYEHMAQAIKAGASAVAAGAMFQFTAQTPKGAARYLSDHGIEVRL